MINVECAAMDGHGVAVKRFRRRPERSNTWDDDVVSGEHEDKWLVPLPLF